MEQKGREGGKWDAGPGGRQVPGAPHWQKMGLLTIKHSTRRFVLLKLTTTDRHEASRGLFATAGLLV